MAGDLVLTDAVFLECMGYLTAACGKPISKEAALVYHELLADVPDDVLRVAVRQVALAHRYSTFPPVGTIREASLAAVASGILTPGEAWAIANQVARNIDPELSGKPWRVYHGGGEYTEYPSLFAAQCARAKAPPIVVRAIELYGIRELATADKPEVARAQFVKIYTDLVERAEDYGLLPASLRRELAELKQKRLTQVVKQIGAIPEDQCSP